MKLETSLLFIISILTNLFIFHYSAIIQLYSNQNIFICRKSDHTSQILWTCLTVARHSVEGICLNSSQWSITHKITGAAKGDNPSVYGIR